MHLRKQLGIGTGWPELSNLPHRRRVTCPIDDDGAFAWFEPVLDNNRSCFVVIVTGFSELSCSKVHNPDRGLDPAAINATRGKITELSGPAFVTRTTLRK